MTLPTPFRFSQSNLQDYLDCRRRFQLRYLQHLVWPAIQVEPAMEVERHTHLGALFHRLIQQHLLGLPPDTLSRLAHQPELSRWWSNYLAQFASPAGVITWRGAIAPLQGAEHTADISIHHQAEATLLAPLEQHHLIAQYDVILSVLGEGATNCTPSTRLVIFEWKTSLRRPKRHWLAQRVQTRLYPYVLVRAGSHLCNGQAIAPEQVEMAYWFAEFPDQPERFTYTQTQFEQDERFLTSLIKEIESLDEQDFHLTEHVERCHFCVYRSLCERGKSAADITQAQDSEAQTAPSWETEIDFDLDFEQIAELEF